MGWRVQVAVSFRGKPYLKTSFSSTPITIGAHPENDLVLDDSIVSAKHAVVLVSRNQLVFRDHSTNGSFYQGQRIEKDAMVGARGTISIPPFEVELAFESQADGTERKTQYHSHLAEMVPDSPPESAAQPPPGYTVREWAADGPPSVGAPAADLAEPGASPRATRPLPRPPTPPAAEPRDRDDLDRQAATAEASDRARPPTPPLAANRAASSVGLPTLPIPADKSGGSGPRPDSDAGTVLSPAVVDSPAPALLRLVGPSEGQVQQEVPIPARTVRLGRSESADIRLADRTISRLHADISPAGEGAFLVTDLDSSNGTFVNDRRIKETLLQEGDRVRLGEVLFHFHLTRLLPGPGKAQRSESSRLDIEIEELADAGVPIYRVAIRGRVDTHHYTKLSDALDGTIEGGARWIVIDLSQVDYISPAGLGVLVKCLTRLRKRRGDLRLVGLDQRLRDALSLSRVDGLFKGRIADSQELALEGWARG